MPRAFSSVSALAIATALAGLALGGCNQSSQQAATNAPAPLGALPPVDAAVALAPAPAVADLPPAPPPRIGRVASRRDSYAFADRASAVSEAFADAPPDYTYDYEGGRPSVWRTHDDYERVVEETPDGLRDYYYEPGSDQPFYVQDPDYGYGFDNGELVALYDRSGRELPPDEARARWAGRYLARARALYRASLSQQREAVAQANWAAQRNAIDAQRQRWAQAQRQDADWRDYHDQNGPQEQAHWEAERLQRLAWAAHVDQSMNDQQHAQRDWAQAQAEARSSGQPPPPAYGPPPGPPPQGHPNGYFGGPQPAQAYGPPAQPGPAQSGPAQGGGPAGPGRPPQSGYAFAPPSRPPQPSPAPAPPGVSPEQARLIALQQEAARRQAAQAAAQAQQAQAANAQAQIAARAAAERSAQMAARQSGALAAQQEADRRKAAEGRAAAQQASQAQAANAQAQLAARAAAERNAQMASQQSAALAAQQAADRRKAAEAQAAQVQAAQVQANQQAQLAARAAAQRNAQAIAQQSEARQAALVEQQKAQAQALARQQAAATAQGSQPVGRPEGKRPKQPEASNATAKP